MQKRYSHIDLRPIGLVPIRLRCIDLHPANRRIGRRFGKITKVLWAILLLLSLVPLPALAETDGIAASGSEAEMIAGQPSTTGSTEKIAPADGSVAKTEALPEESSSREKSDALSTDKATLPTSPTEHTDENSATNATSEQPQADADQTEENNSSRNRANKAPTRAPQTTAEVWVNASTGSNDNDGTSNAPVKTLDKALELVNDGGTIHTAGSFTVASYLVIDKNVTFTGSGNFLTVASGAKLSAPGKTVTMTGYGTALTISPGAELNDGNWILDGNTVGFKLQGTFNGSSRDALTVSAVGTNVSPFTGAGTALVNCTVNVQATNEMGEQYGALNMTNASLTTRGVWYYFDPEGGKGGLHLDHSDLYAYKATGAPAYKQVMAILADSDLKNGSTLTGDGSRITLSAKLTVDNSKVVIKNSRDGGLNINYSPGEATFTDSTLETTNMRYTPSYGTGQSNGPCYLTFQGSSVVNTDAKDKTADNGGANHGTGSTYVVTGGSYLVAYDPSYNHDTTTPTNGPDNGNEWLSLFTLADPSVGSLNPININGDAYTYPVANASRDGQKHVWTPAAKATFKLNNSNAAFADGTTADKTASTIRGYAFDDVMGNVQPGDPTDANGIKFLGWYYKDASGTEHAFDWNAAQTQTTDLEVYAKWDAKTVIYHNGNGQDYIQSLDAADSSVTALSFDEVVAQNASFAVTGKAFDRWTKSPDGSGDAIAAGSTLAFANGTTQIDLYAQYTDNEYRVAFSANGGTFADTSVFKANSDAFTIEKDATGGEVAVLKQAALYGQKLHDLLGGVSYNDLTPTKAAATKPGYLLNDSTNWYDAADASGDSLRFDDHSLWIFPVAGDNPEITADTTYYLKWKTDSSVAATDLDLSLDSDMWADFKDKTAELKKVYTDGENREFSLTGAVDVASIKQQMERIKSAYPDDAATPENITLSSLSSSFTATITLPDGVIVPENPQVDVAGLGNCFELASMRVDGQNVTVTFDLKSGIENYKQLKDAVDSTGANSSDQLTVTVNGLTLDAGKVANGQELTATGTVSGTFNAIAKNSAGTLHRFAFTWTGDQEDASKDIRATDDSTIQQTLLVVKTHEEMLPADITIGDDTEHAHVYETLQGSRLNFTGTIDPGVVKRQMESIESQFPGTSDYTSVKLSDVSSSFVATFTIPEGMTFPSNLSTQTVTADGFADTFAISDVSVSGNTVTVTMTLRDGIENYQQLKDAVGKLGKNLDGTDGVMKVTVPNIAVNDDVAGGTNLTVTGTVTGTFNAVATSQAGTEKDFSFKWTGEQTAEGKDALAGADNKAIQFTVVTASTVNRTLPGDMLAETNTEHTAVIEKTQGSTFDLTGAINVSLIKDQMSAIESAYPNTPHDAIALDVVDFSFVATFTVPDGMALPTGLDATKVTVEQFGDGFKVADVQTSGKTVTVTFALRDPDAIKTYTDLEKIVDAAGASDGWMKITVPNIKIDSDAPVDENLTIVGAVKGAFSATAESESGTHKAFSFRWNATQWPEGKDAVANDDTTIQLTIKVTKKDIADNPGESEKPGQSNGSKDQGGSNGSDGLDRSKDTDRGNASNKQRTSNSAQTKMHASRMPQTGENTYQLVAILAAIACGAGAIIAGARIRRRRK